MLASFALHAQPTKLFVWLTTGEQVAYHLEERPKMVSEGDHVHLTTRSADIVYATKDLQKVTFDDTPTRIDRAIDGGIDGKAVLTREQMTLSGFPSGAPVRIYDGSGRLVASHFVGADGRLSIAIGALPKGVNIVKTQYKSFKLIKK